MFPYLSSCHHPLLYFPETIQKQCFYCSLNNILIMQSYLLLSVYIRVPFPKMIFLYLLCASTIAFLSLCFVFIQFRHGKIISFTSCNNFCNVFLVTYRFVTFNQVTKTCLLLHICLCFFYTSTYPPSSLPESLKIQSQILTLLLHCNISHVERLNIFVNVFFSAHCLYIFILLLYALLSNHYNLTSFQVFPYESIYSGTAETLNGIV